MSHNSKANFDDQNQNFAETEKSSHLEHSKSTLLNQSQVSESQIQLQKTGFPIPNKLYIPIHMDTLPHGSQIRKPTGPLTASPISPQSKPMPTNPNGTQAQLELHLTTTTLHTLCLYPLWARHRQP